MIAAHGGSGFGCSHEPAHHGIQGVFLRLGVGNEVMDQELICFLHPLLDRLPGRCPDRISYCSQEFDMWKQFFVLVT
jgi:hypothetical protein